jgi:hypothetical protein
METGSAAASAVETLFKQIQDSADFSEVGGAPIRAEQQNSKSAWPIPSRHF